MAQTPLTRAEAKAAVRAVDRAKGVVNHAAASIQMHPATLRSRLRTAKRLFNLEPKPAPAKAAPDPVAARVAKDAQARLIAEHADLARRAAHSENLRAAVFRLTAEPLRPPGFSAPLDAATGKHREAIVLPLSDIHMGEVVDRDAMDGRNSYNNAIARKRLERYFSRVVHLGTRHWSGPDPAVIYLVLLGDLIAGEIHEELAKTNDLLAIPAVRDLAECLVSGIDLLLKSFACDIRVVALPGNHGRTTKKPESKGHAVNSYDTLVAWCVERHYAARGEKRVTFSAPASGDALIAIHGWNILFTHGDRIGSRGGMGMIGPAATAARGMQRLIQDYAAEGQVIDACVIGHFHAPLRLEQGLVNNSIVGPSEYSRAGRMRSHPASQWMLTVHPGHGPFARVWEVRVGDPAEGSIYKGRAG